MYRKVTKMNVLGIALALFLVVASPVAAAGSSPPDVTIPDWLTRIQYPGTSSEPTVYVDGPIAIPAWLARIQHPGTSSQPTVNVEARARGNNPTAHVRDGRIAIPAWLARVQHPGTSSKPTVLVSEIQAVSGDSAFHWGSAVAGGGFVGGMAILGAGTVLALRRRQQLGHV